MLQIDHNANNNFAASSKFSMNIQCYKTEHVVSRLCRIGRTTNCIETPPTTYTTFSSHTIVLFSGPHIKFRCANHICNEGRN